MAQAFLLDRDGVIIENRDGYVCHPDQIEFLAGAFEALQILANTSNLVLIITNQSAIGRGVIKASTAAKINRIVCDAISSNGGRIDGVFVCPHKPDDNCNCRKPQPGLIFQAIEKYDIDPSKSKVIGDALSDISAGRQAGINNLSIVKTGRGKDQLQLPDASEIQPYNVFRDLRHAVTELLEQDKKYHGSE